MAQNIDFSGSDQIQTPQYPEIHPSSQEISDEVFQANHSDQNEETFKNPSNEIAVSNSNEEKEGPSQDSDIRNLIREECCIEVCEEQRQSMEDTMLELVKICQEREFLCIHDNVEGIQNVIEHPAERGNLIESLQNFRVIHKSSISLNTSQISSIHAVATILSTKEFEYSSSMGYEHLSITPKTESDKVTESNAKNLLPIPSECEVTSKDKRDCDVPVSTIPVCDNYSDIFSDSKNDDDISVDDDDFEDIEYVEASLLDLEIISLEEDHVVQHDVEEEEEEVDLEDISQIQDVVLREKLLSITRLISNIESLNDNSTPDCVLNSFESNNSLADTFSPEFETFCDNTEETRSGNTTHADNSLPEYDSFCFEIEPDQERDIRFLKELLIENSILFHESSDSNFEDNPSIPRPLPKPPDAEFDAGEEIPVMINNKDKFDEDYYFFMFDKVFSFLSAESEDTIFNPGFFPQ
nr:hypothetical protein [Tanacetum cinerariifolium]